MVYKHGWWLVSNGMCYSINVKAMKGYIRHMSKDDLSTMYMY